MAMTWDELRNILERQILIFATQLLDSVEAVPAKRPTLIDEIKRLSTAQKAIEEQADAACLVFAESMQWPEMSGAVRDAVLLRLTSGRQLVDFLSGRKRVMNRHAVKPMKDEEGALRFVLVEWWHFLGRIPWEAS